MLKIELSTSRLGNPIMQHHPFEIGGLNEKFCLGWVSLKSNVFCAFVSDKRLTVFCKRKL